MIYPSNLKIALALVLSILIFATITRYTAYRPFFFPNIPIVNKPLLLNAPFPNTIKIGKDLAGVKNFTAQIFSFKLPSFSSPSQNLSQNPAKTGGGMTFQKKPIFNFPTKSPTYPKTPTIKLIPTVKPIPSATKPPLPPTKIPTPTEQPITAQRPGTNFDETLKIVSQKTCVPPALFKAIGQNESGGRLSALTKSEFILFNRYNWWNEKTTSLTQVCYGIAYNHHTGLVPNGAQYSNQRCYSAENFSTDVFSMGFMSISQDEENSYRDRVLKLMITDKIDRRVIFDTLMIAGLHYKNISTYRGDNCNDWEGKYIAKAACKYLGKCHYDWTSYGGPKGDYCQDVCDYYNQFTSGKKADCNNVSSRYFVASGDDGSCTLK